MSQEVKVVGMAWYKPEDYDEIRRVSADGETMAPTYQDWLDSAQELFDRVKIKGHTVEKVYIDPDTFPSWCAERGLSVDSQARAHFADAFVAGKYFGTNAKSNAVSE